METWCGRLEENTAEEEDPMAEGDELRNAGKDAIAVVGEAKSIEK
jgi:hypothetical protein